MVVQPLRVCERYAVIWYLGQIGKSLGRRRIDVASKKPSTLSNSIKIGSLRDGDRLRSVLSSIIRRRGWLTADLAFDMG